MRKYLLLCRDGSAPWYVQYAFNMGVHMSQFLSVLLLGDPDETICSRCGKAVRAKKWWAVHMLGPFLNWFMGEEDHVIKVIEDDEGKKAVWDWSK